MLPSLLLLFAGVPVVACVPAVAGIPAGARVLFVPDVFTLLLVLCLPWCGWRPAVAFVPVVAGVLAVASILLILASLV